MEVWNKLFRCSAELYNLVGYEVRLDAGYTIAIDTFNSIKSLDQVDELLTCGATEITRVDTCDYDLALSCCGNLLSLCNDICDSDVTARASGIVNGAVCTLVVASILDLKEGACAVSRGVCGKES